MGILIIELGKLDNLDLSTVFLYTIAGFDVCYFFNFLTIYYIILLHKTGSVIHDFQYYQHGMSENYERWDSTMIRNGTIKWSLFLFITIMFWGLFYTVANADIASGDYHGLYWELDDEGTLTITGTGPIVGFGDDSSEAWHAHELDIRKVIISDGVTSIGHYAFADCSYLVNVSISQTATSIGIAAFSKCINLSSIIIPESVTTIEMGAFYECRAISSIILPSNLEVIEGHAFAFCESLMNVQIPNKVTKLNDLTFAGCYSLESIDFSEGLIEIGEEAFSLCRRLKSVSIPTSLRRISDYAFHECKQMSDVYYAGTEESKGKILVGSGNSHLSSATWHFGGHETILPAPVANGEWYDLTWDLDDDGTLTIYGNGPMRGFSADSTEAWRPYEFDIKSVTIGNGITNIGMYAFSGCSYLSSIVIPNTVESIDLCAFNECINLVNISIPNSVIKIDMSAFYKCKKLANLDLHYGLIDIESYAFCFCESLESIILPSTVKSIGSQAFGGCSKLKSIDLPEGISEIQDNMFFICYELSRIYIPKSVRRIDDYAFYSCKKLSDVFYGGTQEDKELIIIGSDYSRLQNATWHFSIDNSNIMRLPSETVIVDDYAFANTAASVYIIPEGTRTIKAYSFMNLSKVSKIYLPSTLNDIDETAFLGSEHALFICPSTICDAYNWAKRRGLNVFVE